jgi:hypothetical protein
MATTEQLEQLHSIFPDKSLIELATILRRHNNDVQEAAEAVLLTTSETSTVRNDQAEDDIRSTCTTASEALDGRQVNHSTSFAPTLVAPPRPPPTTAHTDDEETQLQQALEQSMATADRGLDYLSDKELAEIMNDPIFLASLDEDLKTAVQMQQKLEVAEEEWKSVEHQKQSKTLRRLKAVVQKRLAEKKLENSPIVVRARSRLGISTHEEEALVQRLEAMNRENADEQHRRAIRLEARQAMMDTVGQHLNRFRTEHPAATYREWIQELHPENAHVGQLLPDLEKTIDHRFYVPESEHLQLWNASCKSTGDDSLLVAFRTGGDKDHSVLDLLSGDECYDLPSTTKNATFDLLGPDSSPSWDDRGVQDEQHPFSSSSVAAVSKGVAFTENTSFGPFGLNSSAG